MMSDLLDWGIIGGGFVGIIGLFFPKLFFSLLSDGLGEEKYNPKNNWKYRLWALLIVVIASSFYVYDTYFYGSKNNKIALYIVLIALVCFIVYNIKRHIKNRKK